MFGFKNFTGFSFIGKVGKLDLEFTAGIVNEITFNITGSAAAHAAKIPQNINVKFISKDQFITCTSAVVSSKISQTKIIGVIAGTITNLLIR